MIKHFLDISDFKKSELRQILTFAKKIKKKPDNYNSLLKNKFLGLFFEKPSNRTRLSFDIGMKRIGGNVIELNTKEIGFGKRESSSDIINTLSQFIDCLVVRDENHLKIKKFAKFNFLPIVNGLSSYSHPCQILSDIFTIEEIFGDISNASVTWIGDINNVLRSLLQASLLFDFNLNIASPKKILSNNKLIMKQYESKKIHFYDSSTKAIKNCQYLLFQN